jgi:hemoglobin
MNRGITALAALALYAGAAIAHEGHHDHDHAVTFEGHSYAVELKNRSSNEAAVAQDRLTFHKGQVESEWLKREGFAEGTYEADDDEFEAKFVKGEEEVRYEGEWENGALTGKVEWGRHHEGGKRKWNFVGRPEAAAVHTTTTTEHTATATVPTAEAPRSLFERIGGEPALTAVVDTFVNGMVADPTLNANPVIKARLAKADAALLKKQLVEFVGKATGGNLAYTGRDMKTIHHDMNIGEKDWAAMADVFVKTLNQYKVPKAEQDELLAIVGTTKADIVTKP